jgi:hypothetical protein
LPAAKQGREILTQFDSVGPGRCLPAGKISGRKAKPARDLLLRDLGKGHMGMPE